MSTRIPGIESSYDETAAAIVVDGREILSSVVASQMDIHRKYGGVVPELASREHLRQGALARAIRAHHGMYFTSLHFQADAVEDFFVTYVYVQVFNA